MASLPKRAGSGAGTVRLPAIGSLLALLMLVLGACGDDGEATTTANGAATSAPTNGELEVELSDRSVRAGATFSAAILNRSDMAVTYGAGYTLERETEDGSFEMFPIRPEPIPDIGLVAKPGERGPEVEVEVPKRATPGTYRVVLSSSAQNGQPSAEFTVRR